MGGLSLNNELNMVIGMSLAYITSFAGLILAYFSYRKHKKQGEEKKEEH